MIDYDRFAPHYTSTRYALPWLLDELRGTISDLQNSAAIVEIGCGTGNYVRALADENQESNYRFFGFDRSQGMLAEAITQATGENLSVDFVPGDGNQRFPFTDDFCDLLFAVDVIHQIENLIVFFAEAARVLRDDGFLLIATDSEEDIRNRSLSVFFPETLGSELNRYPRLSRLHEIAQTASLQLISCRSVSGNIDIDDDFIAKLEQKCASALHQIPEQAFRIGMENVRLARRQTPPIRWRSLYSVIVYQKKPLHSR